ncbi:MAG: hypothetical protein MZV64_49340 [Ignavibacteriales bacterium]|nr:hypothetical protein [Ignavibacteriales bacterium]
MTKLRAVSTKIVHRVRFYQADADLLGLRDGAPPDRRHLDQGPRPPRKAIPNELQRDHRPAARRRRTPSVIFSPVGAVANFAVDQNSIVHPEPEARPPETRWTNGSSACSWADRSSYAKRKSS